MKELAKALLRIKAVSLSPEKPFTWASGIKSPIYCDNRLILSFREERELALNEMKRVVSEKYPEAECLMGTATAGIPHAAIVAWELGIPMGFVRGKAKDHGKENRIEGKVFPGMKTVVIEDLISTAGSSVDAVNALRDAGCDVLGIISIFTYNLKKGEETLKKNDVENTSLTDYDELIEAAIEENYIESASLAKLMEWKKDPSNEEWMTK